jgi:hypothetical protein
MEYAEGVRRHGILITLLASYAAVAAFAILFQLRVRPSVLAAFNDYATPMPVATRIALSGWLLPGATAITGLLAAVALAAPLKRSQRHGLAGSALVIASITLVFAVWAAFAPLFQPQ